MRTHHEYGVGDMVRVAVGPFEGIDVKVVGLTGAIAMIMLKILGRENEVSIPAADLEKNI